MGETYLQYVFLDEDREDILRMIPIRIKNAKEKIKYLEKLYDMVLEEAEYYEIVEVIGHDPKEYKLE